MFHWRRVASGALKRDISIELARGHFHKVATNGKTVIASAAISGKLLFACDRCRDFREGVSQAKIEFRAISR
jgi:hypothetical protein